MDVVGHRSGLKTIWAGVVGNALLIAVKGILGVVGRSQALLADAVHSVTDFATDILAFAGLRYSMKDSDRDHPFGHGKIETLMSLFIGLALLAAGVWIGYAAVVSFFADTSKSPNAFALLGAVISILIKEGLYQYTVRVGRRIKSQVLVANAWHHRSDALSSIAVIAGVGAAILNPAWGFMDAIAALAVSLLIIKVGVDVIVPAFHSAADAAPAQERLEDIHRVAESVEGVQNAHDIRARNYAGMLYVEVHAVVDPNISVKAGHDIANDVRDKVRELVPDILDVIVHIDPGS